MRCFKCGKEMDREDDGSTLKGVEVAVSVTGPSEQTRAGIEYRNLQLGKYSDRGGGCKVAICFECYIDALFNTPLPFVKRIVGE